MYNHMSTCYLALLFFLDGELLVCPQKMSHLCLIWGQMKVPSQLVDSSTGDASQEDFMEVMYLETKMGMLCYYMMLELLIMQNYLVYPLNSQIN